MHDQKSFEISIILEDQKSFKSLCKKTLDFFVFWKIEKAVKSPLKKAWNPLYFEGSKSFKIAIKKTLYSFVFWMIEKALKSL